MAYSRHGHFIPGTINRGEAKPDIARDCGAFDSCPSCMTQLSDCREESIRLSREWIIHGGPKPPEKPKLDEYFDNFVELLDEVVEKPMLRKLLRKEVEFLRNAVKEETKVE